MSAQLVSRESEDGEIRDEAIRRRDGAVEAIGRKIKSSEPFQMRDGGGQGKLGVRRLFRRFELSDHEVLQCSVELSDFFRNGVYHERVLNGQGVEGRATNTRRDGTFHPRNRYIQLSEMQKTIHRPEGAINAIRTSNRKSGQMERLRPECIRDKPVDGAATDESKIDDGKGKSIEKVRGEGGSRIGEI